MTEATAEKFEQWALLEIMGHQRFAGLVSEATIAGGAFLRIDIPETESGQAFTKFFNPSSVYAMTPMEEAAARSLAGKLDPAPVKPWEIQTETIEHGDGRGRRPALNHDDHDDHDHF